MGVVLAPPCLALDLSYVATLHLLNMRALRHDAALLSA